MLSGFAYTKYHGTEKDYIGTGMLNLAIPYIIKAKICVCIGSGGGFVPALMRLTQREAEIPNSKTFLVDANVSERGFGSPERSAGWLSSDNPFKKLFPDIELCIELSEDFARTFRDRSDHQIDYLHIDGDHTMKGCADDFINFEPLLSEHAIITFHDTRYSSVQKAIGYIRQKYPNYDIIDMPELSQGIAIAKKRRNSDCPTRLGGARNDPESDVEIVEKLAWDRNMNKDTKKS